jgi:hypothetical protein
MFCKKVFFFPLVFSLLALNSCAGLGVQLSELAQSVKPGIYEHYKEGKKYRVLSVALHSETREEMVVYKALYDQELLWVRPLALFLGFVTVAGEQKPRFAYRGE